MMKRLPPICCLLVLMALALYVPGSLAQNSVLDYRDDFCILDMCAGQNDEIILCGNTDLPSNPTPTLICCDSQGNVVWEIRSPDTPGLYYRAVWLTQDQLLAVRFEQDNYDTCLLEIVDSGEILREMRLSGLVRQAFPVQDGVMLFVRDESGQLSLTLIGTDGTPAWSALLPERIWLDALVQSGDVYIAAGYTINAASEAQGLVLTLDSTGEVLWRYDSPYIETLSEILPCDSGFYVAGDTFDSESDIEYGSLLFFDGESLVYQAGSAENVLSRMGQSVLDAYLSDSGCTLVLNEMRKHGLLYLQSFDENGEIVSKQEMDIAPILSVLSARVFDGPVRLVATGYCETWNFQKYVTVLCHDE